MCKGFDGKTSGAPRSETLNHDAGRAMNVRRPQKKRQVVRILIADTFKLFGETCRTLFEPEFEVVGVVTDASEISEAAAR